MLWWFCKSSISVSNSTGSLANLYIFYFSRIRKFRNQSTPVLYLNAGDTYTGTPLFNMYKDKIVTAFMNLLKPDAIVSAPNLHE